eukprot:CAMPEP_0116903312 /NCGR_PEP_ID=MMETSP0467-20121206/10653_1 /TAXON_ID=283647 /ORGANISM="Mesodinium pulex, Strain SPMC105" /LENGTH=153 /DNA_ID=CAMNT_0004577551 /DNA_START=1602 /DNA_END=2063 /DNA_ORIENTATION=+
MSNSLNDNKQFLYSHCNYNDDPSLVLKTDSNAKLKKRLQLAKESSIEKTSNNHTNFATKDKDKAYSTKIRINTKGKDNLTIPKLNLNTILYHNENKELEQIKELGTMHGLHEHEQEHELDKMTKNEQYFTLFNIQENEVEDTFNSVVQLNSKQ